MGIASKQTTIVKEDNQLIKASLYIQDVSKPQQ